MSLLVRQMMSRTRSFPRTAAVAGFLLVSAAAQLQTLVNLQP